MELLIFTLVYAVFWSFVSETQTSLLTTTLFIYQVPAGLLLIYFILSLLHHLRSFKVLFPLLSKLYQNISCNPSRPGSHVYQVSKRKQKSPIYFS